MRSERPRRITGHGLHFIENLAKYPERWEITDDHLRYVLDHAEDGIFYRQPNGFWHFRVYVPDLGYVVRAIFHEDGRVRTAYNDTGETKKLFEGR